MPPLIDSEFKTNLVKEKKNNNEKSDVNLDNFGFEIEGGINKPFKFNLKNIKNKEILILI